MSKINEIINASAGGAPTADKSVGKQPKFGINLPQQYADLLKEVAPNRSAGIATNVMWAINNAGNDFTEIDVTRIPSRTAVLFLRDAHSVGVSGFMMQFSKFLTDRGSAEAAAEEAFRQRQMNGMLDEFILHVSQKYEQSHGADADTSGGDATGSERPS